MMDRRRSTRWRARPPVALAFIGLAASFSAGCSLKRSPVNVLGDALAGSGGVYASDDDSELIREAIRFGLKTYESLLAVSPKHRGLLLSAASGFTAYAYLVQDDADRLDATDLPRPVSCAPEQPSSTAEVGTMRFEGWSYPIPISPPD